MAESNIGTTYTGIWHHAATMALWSAARKPRIIEAYRNALAHLAKPDSSAVNAVFCKVAEMPTWNIAIVAKRPFPIAWASRFDIWMCIAVRKRGESNQRRKLKPKVDSYCYPCNLLETLEGYR